MDGSDEVVNVNHLVEGRPLKTRDSARHGISLSVLKSIDEVTREEWDAVSNSASGEGMNPFLTWDFLHALEASKSVDPAQGWMAQHLIARDEATKRLIGCVPLYLKSHSYGEYVFDHIWARAYRAAVGGPLSTTPAGGYYPKLQACIPFTPVTGPRVLVSGDDAEARAALHRTLTRGLIALVDRLGVSSVHATFATREEGEALGNLGFLRRLGLQYHWQNNGFKSFEDYLASLKQGRRKTIRQERRKVSDAGVVIRRLRGDQITSKEWDAFYAFYTATAEEKWGRSYLTREFFERAFGKESSAELRERVLLVIAEESATGELIAGALNLIGDECLFGRHWGCSKRYDALHFEMCYYQAIEAAIELGLPRVEAGAQGDHKIARGYLPTLTHSAHYLREPSFRTSVEKFLDVEREQTYVSLARIATEQNPFKEPPAAHLQRQGVRIEGKRIIISDQRR